MKNIVAVLVKDGKMAYLKNDFITYEMEQASVFEDWNDAVEAMHNNSFAKTIYPLAWFVLNYNEENKEWRIKTHTFCESNYSY